MQDWNVVVTARDRRFREVLAALEPLGEVAGTDFFNVLVVKAPAGRRLLEDLRRQMARDRVVGAAIAHVVVVEDAFLFQSREQFEASAPALLLKRLAVLAGHSFHVRIHRRGFKGRLSSQIKERRLAQFVQDPLKARGDHTPVRLEDSGYTVLLEIVGQRAGPVLWSRTDRARYPFVSAA
ncbi:MAG: hypothetical protein WCC36_12740 [Gammaproteobacteria bacterium]